ncbi:MAG: hypothetical protein GF355_01060 [Candidatus Eisenbacteria bacterium]|nr:hypothetical protein [Candidatus Eisenbacteria bacterium]
MQATWEFARELRDYGAIDMMNLSMVIPLPGTDMWECLTIEQKMAVLINCVPEDHPRQETVQAIVRGVMEKYGHDLEATRYNPEPERLFWEGVYRLPDETQILIMQSYDDFNADAAHKIDLGRPDPAALWAYREAVVEDFYGGVGMKWRMLKHVYQRSNSLTDIGAYLTLMGRKYEPAQKMRPEPVN